MDSGGRRESSPSGTRIRARSRPGTETGPRKSCVLHEMCRPAWVRRQHALEIAEELRQAIGDKIGGTALRLAPLVLVIETRRDRMMGVVHLDDEIGEREFELVRPQAPGVALGARPWRAPRNSRMFAVCPINCRPLFRNGGAKGGKDVAWPPISASMRISPFSARATSTYGAPASSSASRTNSPRP